VPTFVHDPQPPELRELIDRRRRLGQDLFDEVWEGVLHMNPAPRGGHGAIESQLTELLAPLARARGLVHTGQFNVGESERDYRVPDLGLHRDFEDRVWYSTAALVVEIVSPGDESYRKFAFYAAHGVDEMLIVDPQERRVQWLALSAALGYEPVERSGLIKLGPREVEQRLSWP
jgi:Uma2 family endonuclease